MLGRFLQALLLGVYALVSLLLIIVMSVYVTRKEGSSGILG